jgi:protein TonB
MLAYAGGDLAPGILSSGSPKGEGDRFIPAVTLSLPEPSYPRVCRRRGQEGTVVLSVDIGVDGRPGKISVTDTSGFSRLDRAAADALKRAVFKPARQNAVFIKSTKQLAFTFRLEDEDN